MGVRTVCELPVWVAHCTTLEGPLQTQLDMVPDFKKQTAKGGNQMFPHTNVEQQLARVTKEGRGQRADVWPTGEDAPAGEEGKVSPGVQGVVAFTQFAEGCSRHRAQQVQKPWGQKRHTQWKEGLRSGEGASRWGR